MKNIKGITLISLVITIIILLILAGISIQAITSDNGLFARAKQARQQARYSYAKEEIILKLMEIQTDCIKNEKEYNINEIEIGMKNASNIIIEKYYYKNEPRKEEISAIVVSVNQYSEYKFLLGNTENIPNLKGVLKKQNIDDVALEEFKEINLFEKENFDKIINNNDNKENKNVEPLISLMQSNMSDTGICHYKSGDDIFPSYYSFDKNKESYSTSALTYQSEDYLEYDFFGTINIKKIEISFVLKEHVFSDCKITASIDGINWDTIYETNQFTKEKLEYEFNIQDNYKNKEYQFIRIWQLGTRLGAGDNRMCVGDVQISGISVQNFRALIDKATSNNSTTGICHYKSAEFPSAPAYYSFDRNTKTYSMSNLTYQSEDYLEYDFNKPIRAKQIILDFYSKDFIFSNSKITASLDGKNWDTIIEKDDFENNIINYILIVPNQYSRNQYKYFRIWQLGNRKGGGDNRMGIGEIQILGTD